MEAPQSEDADRPPFGRTWWLMCIASVATNIAIRYKPETGWNAGDWIIGIMFGVAMAMDMRTQSRQGLRIAGWLVLPLFGWLFYLMRADPTAVLLIKGGMTILLLVAIRCYYSLLPEKKVDIT